MAAVIAATERGAQVHVVERATVGGTCVNVSVGVGECAVGCGGRLVGWVVRRCAGVCAGRWHGGGRWEKRFGVLAGARGVGVDAAGCRRGECRVYGSVWSGVEVYGLESPFVWMRTDGD
eukprot:ctg_803.g198